MATPSAAADPPWCGGRDLDMGGGFHATLYMFAGAPEFQLSYDVPAAGTHANDAIVAAAPVRIQFSQIDAPPSGAWGLGIGYTDLDLRERDGRRLDPDGYRLDCGPGVALILNSAHDRTHSFPPGLSSFPTVFSTGSRFDPRPETAACFAALQRSGHFRFSLSRHPSDPPALVLEGDWPLAATIEAVRALRGRELERARRSQCRLMPPPPPPD